MTIKSGQSVPYSITFMPTDTGTISAAASFRSNASNSPAKQSLSAVGVKSQQHSVALTWDPSTSDVVGYNVYRGKVRGGPYNKINAHVHPNTLYFDKTVTSGNTYYYVTTAVDSSGMESTYSNEVKAVIPKP
jgi:fibronectin type 3 domain-containing protein